MQFILNIRRHLKNDILHYYYENFIISIKYFLMKIISVHWNVYFILFVVLFLLLNRVIWNLYQIIRNVITEKAQKEKTKREFFSFVVHFTAIHYLLCHRFLDTRNHCNVIIFQTFVEIMKRNYCGQNISKYLKNVKKDGF